MLRTKTIKSDYDNIKSVCSIWVCMNMKQDTLNHIHLVSDAILGNYEWKGNLDLVNIFMIGVAEKLAEKKEENELQHFLGVLFSNCLTTNEKMDILHEEFRVNATLLFHQSNYNTSVCKEYENLTENLPFNITCKNT